MPSYRRNSDYSSQFKWTYELKQDVFHCYKLAKSDPRIGYMKRMKKLWDNIHPELNHFSDKNLRDTANRIEKDNIVLETEFNYLTLKSYNDNNDITDNCQGDDEEQKDNDNVITEKNIQYHFETKVNSSETATFMEELKDLFMDNITAINNKKLIERRFDTRLNKKINNNVILALDKIAKDYITSLNSPTLCDINVTIYTVAIKAKQYNNDLKETPAEKTKSRQQPRWITELEHPI